jgi:hypothetical protein
MKPWRRAVTLKAYEAAWKSLKEGMTQGDFARLVSLAHDAARVHRRPLACRWASSRRSRTGRHHAAGGEARARILLIDGGCKVEGYSARTSRAPSCSGRRPTAHEGGVRDRASRRRARRWQGGDVRDVAVRSDIDAAARKVIVDGGYRPGLHLLLAPRGARPGDGRARVAVPREGATRSRSRRGWCSPTSRGSTSRASSACGSRTTWVDDRERGGRLFTPQSESLERPF